MLLFLIPLVRVCLTLVALNLELHMHLYTVW